MSDDEQADASSDESPVPIPVLPTLGAKLAAWLGFQLPALPALPQTIKNLDKSLGRLISAGFDNISSRIEGDTKLREASRSSEAKLISHSGAHLVSKIDDNSEIAQRALDFSFGESVLKQSNREKIAYLAIENFASTSQGQNADASSEVDDDWLNSFSDFASTKSDESIQNLWAKILAGKIRQPTNFSLKSIQMLSAIDMQDANLIHEILSYAISDAFIFKNDRWTDLTRFTIGENLGVLSGTSGLLHNKYTTQSISVGQAEIVLPLTFSMNKFDLVASLPALREIMIPIFTITRFGQDLLKLSDGFTRDESYEGDFIAFLKQNSAVVKRRWKETGLTEEV